MKAKAFLLAIAAAVFLFGCGKEEEPDIPADTAIDEPSVEISVGGGESDVVNITKIPKEEWVDLTWEQVRDFTLVYLPSYREVYGIPEDKELTDEDWKVIKGLMFYQLFDQIYENYLSVGNVYHDVQTTEEMYGVDWIYFAPTKEYLESLGPDEIAAYFQEFYPKVFGVTPVDNDGNEIEFRSFTDEQLNEAMGMFIREQF